MRVSIIGASGNAGSRIASELISRGHEITGIARHPEKIEARDKMSPQKGDIYDTDGLASVLAGHDAVIHAVRFLDSDPKLLIDAVRKAAVNRLLVVGGAGSLEVASGVQLLDTPEFPAEYRAEASAGREFLSVLRGEQVLDWTFLSPSALFMPGERIGKFRLGTDQLLANDQGESKISMEDYAIAMADELENPQHPRQRFTVGY